MTTTENKLRIGRIDFTNVWPVFHHFPMHAMGNSIEFVKQVPTGLNRALAAGEIDMSAISSFAYGESFQDYVLLPDLSVSALGPVNSLLLFHKKPIEELRNGRIALPTTSATTNNLLKIIMEKKYGGKPAYTYARPDLDEMMPEHDGALLIGDHAIKASWLDNGYIVTDLGQEWKDWTGRWMSFAVWAVRKSTIERSPELVKKVWDGFVESKRKSLQDLTGVVSEAVRTIGGTETYWHHYFSHLCYEFGPDQWSGLELYYQYAWELGFLPEQVPIQIWSDITRVRVTE
ncbi:menaquinone biosynthesis protein [Paenibacillus lutrae]|uniref:Chorismate dehydratase n=1 Tax=Paenibacillus lutrae TaxID=2078573 RepID=A0A7X3FI27_9BACL|nr:menaquinone biosynthesis protein [Paenibacillus lutrae]MVP00041.1 ABC transporter substrate-binding protein [Paenibacillus lutrae]